MKIRFTTRSGSEYEINEEAKTWNRLTTTGTSGRLRGEGGKLTDIPPRIVLHLPAILYCEPHKTTPKGMMRTIVTSKVDRIEIVEEENEMSKV